MKYWFYSCTKWLLWLVFRCGFGLEVMGQEHVPPSGPFILAANHVSYLDPPVLGAACPRRLSFMARASLFRQPWLAAFMRGVHVIPLQRGEGDLDAIREAVRRLRRGEPLAIFPEGGRQFSGQLGQARRGVGLLATTAHAPIVPALIQGTFQAFPPHAGRLSRAKIRVAFGPQIPYTTASPPSGLPEGGPHTVGSSRQSAKRAHHERLAEALTHAWGQLANQLASGHR